MFLVISSVPLGNDISFSDIASKVEIINLRIDLTTVPLLLKVLNIDLFFH